MKTISSILLSAIVLLVPACAGGDGGDRRKRPRVAAPNVGRVAEQRPGACRICVEPPSAVRLERGQSTKATWMVTGTTRPVRARIQNKSPGAVEVGGGDTQYVMSSGGTPNVITLEVTGRSPGAFEVEVAVDEHDAIAAVYRAELQRIAEELRAASKRLRGRRVQTADLLAILDDVEEDVARSLPFDELAPFRDAVGAQLDEFRRQVSAMTAAPQSDATVHLVAQRSSGDSVPTPAARSLLSQLADFFSGASDTGPRTEICVVTLPVNGATLLLYPKSAPDMTERVTATRFPIYVGLYTWEIKRMSGYVAGKGSINFLTDPDRVVECTLRRSANDANVCEPVMGDLNQRCRR